MKAICCFESSGVEQAGVELKLQHPSSKHQRMSKHQSPNQVSATMAVVRLSDIWQRKLRWFQTRLELEVLSFSGAWSLKFGAFIPHQSAHNEGSPA